MQKDKLVFNWIPLAETITSHKPKVRTARFGDGYEQRSQDGINSDLISIALKFDGKDDEMEALLRFLKERRGVESFYYTHKFGVRKLFVCQDWSRVDLDGLSSEVSATFREVVN